MQQVHLSSCEKRPHAVCALCSVVMIRTAGSTHSVQMDQRMIVLMTNVSTTPLPVLPQPSTSSYEAADSTSSDRP